MWPTRSYRHSGFTLVEVMISAGLLTLVMVGAYALIAFSVRWNLKMKESVDTYQQALKVYSRVSYDLSTGSRESFIYGVDGFAFASARPPDGPFRFDSAGELLWHRYIVYYVEEDTLYRHEFPIEPAASILPETPTIAIFRSKMTHQSAVMARDFSEFEIDPGSGASITFKIDKEHPERGNSFQLESRMTFRQ
jgi:prepilin-type N-terminal cleavage/methylation domain-containing protein